MTADLGLQDICSYFDLPDLKFRGIKTNGSVSWLFRVYSAHVKEVDDKAPVTNWGAKTVFPTLMQEFVSSAGVYFLT